MQKVKEKAQSVCCKRYALILMDINMPIMDGIEAGTLIKQLAASGTIPDRQAIVALTGDQFTNEEEKRLRDQAGFCAFYVKPVSRRVFEEIVDSFYNFAGECAE